MSTKNIRLSHGGVVMLSKGTFCKALTMIREQRQINETFSDALELAGEGYYCFGVNSRYLDALLMVMKEAMDDKYDYIDWWLYEAAEDYQVEDDEHIWCLKEPEALYDFIRDECQ